MNAPPQSKVLTPALFSTAYMSDTMTRQNWVANVFFFKRAMIPTSIANFRQVRLVMFRSLITPRAALKK